MRKILTVSIAALVAASLAGCATGPVVGNPKEAAPTTPAAETTPTPEPEPQAEAGTRANPVAVGTPAKHSSDSVWTYTFGATDTDGWPEIQAENQYNTPPAEGTAFLLAPVHVTVDDIPAVADGANPWGSFAVEYVTASGNSYGTDHDSCQNVMPAPGALHEVGTMYGGAQADFLACAQVPTADIAGGTWRVGSMIDASYAVFFVGG